MRRTWSPTRRVLPGVGEEEEFENELKRRLVAKHEARNAKLLQDRRHERSLQDEQYYLRNDQKAAHSANDAYSDELEVDLSHSRTVF